MTDEQQLTAAGNEMSASFLAAKKRSDETLAKLEAKPSSFTMLTGDRPTGRLHLGHYFGSIRERVAMQERGVNTNIIIADYQVITDRDTTEHIQDNVLNLVLDYMAAGIDPNKTMMFTHSAVPAENQLTAAVPVLGHRGRAAPQPDREVRNGGFRPCADRPAAHLPGASGLRHPVLQGQRGADRQGQPAARRNHPHHRTPLQRALRQEEPGVPGAESPSCPKRRRSRVSTAAR